MSAATQWLQERNRGRGMRDRLVPAVLLLKAVALALRQVPGLNGYWVDDHLAAEQQVRLGVAIALRGGGLVVPAIADADRMPVEELMAHLRELVERARRGRMRGSDLAEPTITVTDLGERGVESVMGVIYPPQVALVGLGRVVERPWAVDGLLGVRPLVTATLAADHRASDGHVGGLYLTAFERLVQRPEEL
jgi:pyruvate dehydrogenase E2 component (dihydrolipoamide acetyltransferase)